MSEFFQAFGFICFGLIVVVFAFILAAKIFMAAFRAGVSFENIYDRLYALEVANQKKATRRVGKDE